MGLGPPSGSILRFEGICLTLITSEPSFVSASESSSAGMLDGSFLGVWVQGEGEFFVSFRRFAGSCSASSVPADFPSLLSTVSFAFAAE
jgi:hypothetical protein